MKRTKFKYLIIIITSILIYACKKENEKSAYDNKTLIYETSFNEQGSWILDTNICGTYMDSAYANISSESLYLYSQGCASSSGVYDFSNLSNQLNNFSAIFEIRFKNFSHISTCNEGANSSGGDSYLSIYFGDNIFRNCGTLNLDNKTLTVLIENGELIEVLMNNDQIVTSQFVFDKPSYYNGNEYKFSFSRSSGFDGGKYIEVDFVKAYSI